MTTTDERATDPSKSPSKNAATKRHAGSCHCGAVRFQVDLDQPPVGSRCNCTICTKTNLTGVAVKPAAFTLLAGEADLGFYEWGRKISRRFFCKHCGVQCFGRGHLAVLGGDYVSVNLNAIDDLDVAELKSINWDGRHDNWYAGSRPAPWPIFAEVAPAEGASPARPSAAP